MLTLNQKVKILENIKINHAQLSNGTFYFGDPSEFDRTGLDMIYPLVGLWKNPNNINGKMYNQSYKLYFADLVHQDISNRTEVLSDMESIALDFYATLKTTLEDSYNATVNSNAPVNEFIASWDDDVSGVEMDIQIEEFYNRSTCDTPDSGLNAGKAQIVDQDGNILAYLNPNQKYTVEVLQAIIDTITGNETTVIDPIT